MISYLLQIGNRKNVAKKGTVEEIKALIGNAEIKEAGAGARAIGFNFVVHNNCKRIFLKEKI